MNTNQLKSFAKNARIKLIDQISRKLEYVQNNKSQSFLDTYPTELRSLEDKIRKTGKDQVIEMVAYTWFNRLMALRFMDANGYTTPKVLTPLQGMSNPEILQNALAGHIESNLQLNRQRLNDLIDGKTAVIDAQTEVYKMLLVATCNSWHTAMPFMFEHISDYTELLLPDDLLSDYSIITDIRKGMSDDDCKEEEVIGWLYQFYIADKKDDVFNGLKKNIKITAENIPAATQLFTPRWIVRYMVENTLGKLWLTFKPTSMLKQHMPYYVESPSANEQINLPEGIKGITDITFLDPCQGSGHVLVYAFDLLTKIYEEEGYDNNEIPELILKNNLFGIDIDERAAQLAAFALSMKARSYYNRFLRKPIQPQIIALENVSEDIIQQAVNLPLVVKGKKIVDYTDLTLNLLTQADNFGSLIEINQEEIDAINIQQGSIWQEQQEKLKKQAVFLGSKYHCVVTNPPYMGSRNMNEILKIYVQSYFQDTKRDLFAAFIERCNYFTIKKGLYALINQHSWMFTNDFNDFRKKFIDSQQLQSAVHLGAGVFDEISGEVVQSISFVIQNVSMNHNKVLFYDCTGKRGSLEKENIFLSIVKPIKRVQSEFKELETLSFAYWISSNTSRIIKQSKCLSDFCDVKVGLQTGDNNKFLRQWHEVSINKVDFNNKPGNESIKKWIPYNKGGGYQKFYGNNELLCDWENNGQNVKNNLDINGRPRSVIRNSQYYFRKGISFNLTGAFSARYKDVGFLFDVQGSSLFPSEELIFPLIALLNSKIVQPLLRITNPTLVTQVGDLKLLPIAFNLEDPRIPSLNKYAKKLVEEYKEFWDFNETSWDYNNHSSYSKSQNLNTVFTLFEEDYIKRIKDLQNDETRINTILLDIYNLNSEYLPDIKFSELTLSNNKEIIIDNNSVIISKSQFSKNIISYSIGCIFGRYSLDKPGLLLANQGDTLQEFLKQVPNPSFLPDDDNIIPVLDDEWFSDDILGRFKTFLKAAFGEENFAENLNFIEDTLGKDIRKYLVKDLYNDHIKRYKKRPIYWMFSSPKGHFKALIYMHRYQPDLCSKMLNDYLQAFISKLEAAKETQNRLSLREDISAREKTLAIKEVDKLEAMIKDCKIYEKTLFNIATQKISIDLDDGVKVNYLKFKEVIVPIKGLEKDEE